MKKNVLMRAASGLLVATMLTTCAISGTFAKYVTQDNGGDVARVAKWGVVVQVEGDLYSQKYLNGANTVTDIDGVTLGVNGQQIASPTSNVVAPGTKSENPFTFSINGKPEVDSKTKIEIKAQNIYLKQGTYGVMVPVADDVLNTENFNEIVAAGLYTEAAGTYTKVPAANPGDGPAADTDYYTLEDYVVSGVDYYPVIYNMAGDTTSTSFT
ncbi:MAG: hypothetical protein UHT63_02570, partial [Acutalibacteraceae bacterium]|nr:hypothetical protein [Acutalibacteraceae bacterium]